MSRNGNRTSTKSLVCAECQKGVKAKPGVASRTALSFRGKGQARLDRHMKDVHGRDGGSRRFIKRMAKLSAKPT